MQTKITLMQEINMKESTSNKALNLKTLTKSTVWDVQENDIFRMLDAGLKDADIKENFRHYTDIIRCAFEILEIPELTPVLKKAYTKQGYKVG